MTAWVLKHCRAHAGRPSQKDFKLGIPTAVAQYRALATGQGHRAGGPFKLYSQLSRYRAAVPVRKTSSWAAPAAVAQYLAAATGQGHRAGGPLYSLRSRSCAGL